MHVNAVIVKRTLVNFCGDCYNTEITMYNLVVKKLWERNIEREHERIV